MVNNDLTLSRKKIKRKNRSSWLSLTRSHVGSRSSTSARCCSQSGRWSNRRWQVPTEPRKSWLLAAPSRQCSCDVDIFYLIKTQNSSKTDGNSWVSIPSHLHRQDVEQMEAKAVQSVGVGCRFDEGQERGHDGDHQDEGGKCWPERRKNKNQEIWCSLGHNAFDDSGLCDILKKKKCLKNWYGWDLSKIHTLRGVCRCLTSVH